MNENEKIKEGRMRSEYRTRKNKRNAITVYKGLKNKKKNKERRAAQADDRAAMDSTGNV